MTGPGLSKSYVPTRSGRPLPKAERSESKTDRTLSGAERSARILELQAKLSDEDYMSGAILRIATVLSARLTEGYFNGGRSTR
jgi:hypothetical protein